MTTEPKLAVQKLPASSGAVHGSMGLVQGPLDEVADEQVLREIFGADVDQELLDFASGAGGNARLLTEFALGLLDEGLVRQDNGIVQLIARRIPRRILEFVMCQLNDMSVNCQQFLKVAAAIGTVFMLEDVSRMLDRSSATLLSALDEAMASGFVVAAEHQLAFQSDFLLCGIIESIPAPARDALRREAVNLSGRRTQSYDQGPWVTERYGAVKEEASGSCSRAHSLIMDGDPAAGVQVAERILADSSVSRSVRLDAEASMILGCFLLGREEAAQKLSERILEERGAEPDDIAALMALTARSTVLWRAGEVEEGLRLGHAAVRYSENVDPVWRLHFQLALAGKLANLREFNKAESLIIDVESGLRGLPTPVWTAAPAAMRARLYLQAGRIVDAYREAELATRATEPDAVPMLRPLAYSVLSSASFYMGDLAAATEYLKLAQSDLSDRVVLDSAQYAWTDVLITVKKEGPHAAARLLFDKYSHLPTLRSLYIEVPSAAPFLVVLARDVGDAELERSVLKTVDSLARDNAGVSVIGLTAMHANALANGASSALALIIVQSPDPISVALATEELAKLYSGRAPAEERQTYAGVSSQYAACWSTLSDVELRIAYLVSVGMTNRQIGKEIHLSAHTVNYHLRKMYKQLGINTRVELARVASACSHTAAVYTMGDVEKRA